MRTEVGVIPEKWDAGGLGRFWNVTDCKHVTAEFVPDGFPVASIKEVQSRFVDLTNAKQTTSHFYSLLIEGGRKPCPGDLILSRNATVGEVAQVAEWHPPFAMGQDVCLLRKKSPEHSTEFLQAVFQSAVIAKQLSNLMVGSTFKRINVEQIRNLSVPMPPPSEQRAIAGALSDVDALVDALDQLIAKKRDLKQAAMQQLLTGHKRLHGFHGEWEVKKIGELLKYERPDKYLVKSNNYQDNAKTPVLTANKSFVLGHTNEDFGIYDDLPAIIFDDFTTDSKFVNFRFKVKSSAIKILKTRSAETNLKFAYERMRLVNFSLGEHKRHYISEFQYVEIPTPIPAEQTAIATVLSDMDAEIAALEERLAKTRALKQSMMQELLTGKTRLV
jgi:type I restriction enzyme, S subunit